MNTLKIDKVVLKETKYVAISVLLLSLIMQVVFLIANAYTIYVLLGTLYGSVLAVGNFFLLGMTVQRAAELEDSKEVKQKVRFSYNMRFFGLVVLAAAGVVLPVFNTIAVLVPLLFPRLYFIVAPLLRKDLDKAGGEGDNE